MTATARRVVVTGMGATTPLGGDVRSTWEGALAGRSGARPFSASWTQEYDLPVTFGAQAAVPAEDVLERREIKRLDPSQQFAVIAAREAWADAGTPEVDPLRLASVVATGIGGIWTLLTAYDTLREKGARRVLPLTVPMLMGNGPTAAISLEFTARAGAHTPVSACASGAEALAYGADMIRTGRADIVIAGGTEAAIHPLPIASFAAMHALSRRNEDPARASRPFDTQRDGFVLGEGAGIVVLESEEHARARGARVHAELLSAGLSADAHHVAAPEPEGAGVARAVRDALRSADLTPADLHHVNAHATSTPAGDVAEDKGLRLALGDAVDGVAVSATKSMTGHLLGAAGAVESILTVRALQERTAPPTINVDDLDPDVSLDVVRKDARPLNGTGRLVGLNNAFGFGGHNISLVFASV
ncbi:beta-ketoacyl-[acyl-carrier-protein] synthase family protein [Paenibacillus sp. TRM 82003]|uniref:beta-ketoacyl-[acyl-carrier-protein] synthase family protein n=1 Tax=Kineococcus sp. TRM81007 TaxID=2925831 RepID=UPI001F57B175|nr:beta-ketoacyl-[acyl-carrier-protein] synthase family protein [Kineococcus sp. TRM81007]MCI2240152.1 beta-ketoacyl-[acyl-carrier-protein] synthase family protein [Kineococcus sp. TRM81007]MCI3925541.1 beta-ketoacyl-[acyl-carrier-protein] synthase family protein [Paenibacillus sp. TRM 82003]